MSITSRRSVREKVAATAAASSGETANTDEYTFTPAGTPSIGISAPVRSNTVATSVAVPSPPTNRTRSTGSSPATNASTTRAVVGRRRPWGVGRRAVERVDHADRLEAGLADQPLAHGVGGGRDTRLGRDRREPLQRPPRPVRRSRLGAARDRLRHLPVGALEPDAAAHPGDRVHHESDVHVRSFGGEPLSGRRLAAGRSRLRRPQNKREP